MKGILFYMYVKKFINHAASSYNTASMNYYRQRFIISHEVFDAFHSKYKTTAHQEKYPYLNNVNIKMNLSEKFLKLKSYA